MNFLRAFGFGRKREQPASTDYLRSIGPVQAEIDQLPQLEKIRKSKNEERLNKTDAACDVFDQFVADIRGH